MPERDEEDVRAGPYHLSIPAREDGVDRVHGLLQALWRDHRTISEPDRARFEMAVVEILGNVVEHAGRADADNGSARRVDVTVAADSSRLVATLADDGVPFEIDLSSVTMPDPEAESGRGLALTLALTDDLQYERSNGRNHWRLVCLLRGE